MKKTARVVLSSIVWALLLFSGTLLHAQDKSDSDFDAFQEHFQKDYFTVGGLLQTVGDYQFERASGENGYSVGNARLQVKGVFDGKFGYQLQTNFINSPAVLDANVHYTASPYFSLKAGLFKSPFSYEYLTGAAAIDFVNRSSVVNQLVPKRQVGMQVYGSLDEGRFKYSGGMFNGNGFGRNENADGNFLYSARLEANSGVENHTVDGLMVGLNASYEQSDEVSSGGGVLSGVEGEQLLLGADTRIIYDKMMLAGEFIYSTVNDDDLMDQYNPFGYYVTGGYYVTPKAQLLARWDYFESDVLGTDSESIIGGINIFPSEVSEVQLNYIYPIEEGVDFSRILLNLQIAF
ncbi:MAG: porin [Bacteroidota bacterium]